MQLRGWLERLCAKVNPKREPLDSEALEELRRKHNARCIAFKLLIAANNQALEIMSDMESAQEGERLFGMHYVRSQCARVLANVHQILVQFQDLGGPCPELFEQFSIIQGKIYSELASASRASSGPLLLNISDVWREHVDSVGPKVASLAHAARRLNLNTPEGFVVTAQASDAFLGREELASFIDARIQAADVNRPDELFTMSSAIQQAILKSNLPEEVQSQIKEAANKIQAKFGDSVRWAVRSSALGEDLLEASFAGQYRTVLNVPTEDIAESCKQVIASKYGVTAISYRLAKGVEEEDAQMCVACMRMVNAASGGVVYTQDPLGDHPGRMIITAALGLPKSVVDGEAQSDIFILDRRTLEVVESNVALKRSKLICDLESGIQQVEISQEEGAKASLGEMAIELIARSALRLEQHFGHPQDVEFAFDQEGQLYILQTRPLQVHEKVVGNAPQQVHEDAEVLVCGGMTASQGAAAGEVFILRKDIDAVRCPDKAVAVTKMASPRWAPLLHRISALVTEQGTVAGHLGNVAREFNVPAIFGLNGCVEKLENVGLVTVDADSRTIYAGMIYELLRKRPHKPRPMLGSSVHERLERVMQHIAPLNLLDPKASDFAPANCSTLHDITRYCHEKAVGVMFSSEKDQYGLHQLSKQLFHKVPMQYWVIDLGCGTTGEDRGKFILLEDILSRPMLCIWEGMTAKPMESAPIDMKGFMSVLTEAATNPNLEAASESGFMMRNYFMVSDEFCNLQSRFGFHFCTVESCMGDIAAENYAAFQFKGGAADMRRRVLRAEMIRDILEEFDFRTEVKQDALFARIEGLDKEATGKRLKILGYMIIHTRQLDMVMANATVAASKKESMLQDVYKMLEK
ncbi:pyruvate, water dikinase [Oceanidesulfovibrio indonesiensis]|uniref:Phosphoenolpyruvate synthase n=1 Tax=Oceanidesulfovibrio indonesiensis TaxID=54767 RepID=A0A7M3MAB7_9BACT|nr:PEP/pyruvate-binding domain-containing protein [Oceanidesulfovibrio indonesiensis]TVM14579.1 pyruvate, water dikinase [Oceanidesulfovibrio indonesiensis]